MTSTTHKSFTTPCGETVADCPRRLVSLCSSHSTRKRCPPPPPSWTDQRQREMRLLPLLRRRPSMSRGDECRLSLSREEAVRRLLWSATAGRGDELHRKPKKSGGTPIAGRIHLACPHFSSRPPTTNLGPEASALVCCRLISGKPKF